MNRTPIESFLELVRKSGLVETNRFNAYLERLSEVEGVPEDPKQLAATLVRDSILSKFQSEQLLAGKWRGFYVGKYRVLERIGIGGMGQVYLAEHRTMKRRYAIKVLPRSKATDPSALERFEREARAGGSIDHTNIVRAYDKDQDGDLHYLVMDFVDGCSLSEIVRATGPLDPERVGNYMYQAACGLKHAHESGLIHRDIKPANILVDRQGTVKILDMGLARFFNDQDDMITKKYDETVLGTADYLSPEQAIDSHNVDVRSDFYSLGCTYYYTLAGRPPFDEGSVAQKLIWHQTRSPKSIRELRPEIPQELEAVLQRCMMKQAKDRYASPDDLIAVLSSYADKTFIPTPSELPELSPVARGVPFGAELLSSVPLTAALGAGAAAEANGSPIKEIPGKSPIFDSQLVKRGGEDSTVSIKSDESAEQPALAASAASATPSLTQEEPTQTVLIPPPRGPGIAPRGYSNAPIVIPPSPPAVRHWDPLPSPLPFEPIEPVRVEVFGDTELPSVVKKGRNADDQAGFPHWAWWVTAGILLLAIIAATGLYFWPRSSPGTVAPTKPKAPAALSDITAKIDENAAPLAARTWNVAKVKLDGIDCTSIGEALGKANSGDTILVTDRQVYEEDLLFTPSANKRALRNITVKGEIGDDGKRAKLMPPSTHAAAFPMVAIENVEGVTLSGFLLDGDYRAQAIIEVKGRCPGLVLDDLRIEGFQRTGILVNNLASVARQDARLENLWIRPRHPDNQPVESAISLIGNSCEGLQLRHCRIQGPYHSAILFSAPAQRFMMEQCKLYQGRGQALTFAQSLSPKSRFATDCQQNTFWDFDSAVAIKAALTADDIQLAFRNNLFYQVNNVLQVDDATKTKPESLASGVIGLGNVYDEAGSKPGHASRIARFGIKGVSFSLPTSSHSPLEFLRYPSNSPLQTAGANQSPVGATE